MKMLRNHIQDAGHAAHPGFENCDDESHYEIVEEWEVVPGLPARKSSQGASGVDAALHREEDGAE